MKPRDSWIIAALGTAVLLAAVIGFFADLGGAVATWHGWIEALNTRLGLAEGSFLTRLETPLFVLCVLALALLLVAVQRLARPADPAGRGPGSPISAAEEQIRAQYLAWFREEVENRWRASIHHAHFIDLGLDETADMTTPWTFVYQEPHAAPRVFSSVDQALALFGGRLLLLGAPGSGKSTTLLHIARRLLEEAEADPQAPVPVLLNLSSFRWTRRTRHALRALHEAEEAPAEEILFERWVVGQLRELRRVRGLATVAERWIQEGKIAFLLDGLDEVDEEMLPQVAQSLNATLRYAGPPAVVCSRILEYQKLREDLQQGLYLKGAVTLQPLAPAQIDAYLEKAQATGLREALAGDADLGELARTPLTLSMMVLAYGGLAPTEIPANLSLLDRRHHLFDSYIVRMMQRHARREAGKPFDPLMRETEKTLYSVEQIHRYLGWLAVRLSERMRTAFVPSRLADSLGAGKVSDFVEGKSGWNDGFGARFLATFGVSAAFAALLALGSGGGVAAGWSMALGGPALVLLIALPVSLVSQSSGRFISRTSLVIVLAAVAALVVALHLVITQSFAALLPWAPRPVLGVAALLVPALLVIFADGSRSIDLLRYSALPLLVPLAVLALAGHLDLAVWTLPLGAALGVSLLFAEGNWPVLLALVGVFGGGLALGAAYGFLLDGLPVLLPGLTAIAMFWMLHVLDAAHAGLGLALGAVAGAAGGPVWIVLGGMAGLTLVTVWDDLFESLSERLDGWLLEPCLRLFLFARGALPLRFQALVDYSQETKLLKRASEGFEFIHRLLRDHFAIRRLTPQLRDERGAVRLDVLEQLSRQGESSLDALGQLARHSDAAVRSAAVTGLGRLATPRVVPLLAGLLVQEPDPAVRAALVAGLGEQPESQTSGLFETAQRDASPVVRKAVLAALERQRWIDPTTSWMAHALADPDREVVLKAVLLLGSKKVSDRNRLPSLHSVPDPSRLGEDLLSFLDDRSPDLRTVAARLLEKVGDRRAVPKLRQLSGDADPGVRGGALEALGKLGSAPEITSLRTALRDKEAAVRATAARGLASLRAASPQLAEELWAEAERELVGRARRDRSAEARTAAVSALASFPGEEVPAALVHALSDRAQVVRNAAAHALVRRGPVPELRARFLGWLSQGSLDQRSAAALVLGILEEPEAVAGLVDLVEAPPVHLGRRLLRWCGWTAADVRLTAIEALGRIGGPVGFAKLREIQTTGPATLRAAAERALPEVRRREQLGPSGVF